MPVVLCKRRDKSEELREEEENRKAVFNIHYSLFTFHSSLSHGTVRTYVDFRRFCDVLFGRIKARWRAV